MKCEVRKSPVHGRGVYATERIAKGERIGEYTGQRVTRLRGTAAHTAYFALEDGTAISPYRGGNFTRYLNHRCTPNCEAREARGRIFFYALRTIRPGEEVFLDYNLVGAGESAPGEYVCLCDSPKCRGTMLAQDEEEE